MNLKRLNNDEFYNLFSYLNPEDLLQIRLTSKKINQQIKTEKIWLRFFVLEFRKIPDGPPPAFLLYWKSKKDGPSKYQSFLQLTDIPEVRKKKKNN